MRRALFLLLTLGFVSQINAQVIFYMESPAPVVGNYDMTWADPGGGWGCPDLNIPGNSVLDTLAFALGTDSLCCNAITNPTAINGKIAVLYRGTCEFGVKALNAQNAGAVAVVIINNIPGAPIAMGPGAQGINVTIPVVMITQADGAALRASILTGNATAFIGSKFGFYPNDLGIWPKDYILAPATSNPEVTNSIASEFTAALGSWIINFGQNAQTNVTLHGSITYMGGSVYSQTSSPVTIPAGDSLWVQLPWFSQATYPSGLYKFTYTVASDSADDFTDDNKRRADFTISDTLFSLAPIDTVTLMPITNASYRPSGSTNDFEACLNFRDSLASRLVVQGMWFSAATSATDSLTNPTVLIETNIYSWDDVFTDVLGTVTMDALTPVAFGSYTYTSNLQNQMVYAPFSQDFFPLDNQRYLFCVKASASNTNTFLGFGTTVDYDEHINQYLQPVSPIADGATWYWAGFGTDVVPSIAVKMFDETTLGTETISAISGGNPYPNPASNIVYIPMNLVTGDMEITILDMQGKVIKTEVRNITTPGSLPVNIEGVSNGQYIIRLTNGQMTQSFKVLINN